MKIVVLAGGISTERDVSLVSGTQIYKALKGRGHEVVLLDVFMGYEDEREGAGCTGDAYGQTDVEWAKGLFTLDIDWAKNIAKISTEAPDIEAVKASRKDKSAALFGPNVIGICRQADIVFMALHGDCGENGKVQATFDLFDIKYTGTGYLGAALAMDKSVTKDMFLIHGVKTPAAHLLTGRDDPYEPEFPAVVKICNGGSSIGVYIVHDRAEYEAALDEAYRYEGKVLVEQYIKGRELTDGVIDGTALPVVEIAPKQGFYDYKNKYQAGAAVETCPADIPADITAKVQAAAVAAYKTLCIQTYARIDFILAENGDVYCLEANTLPGMTPTSLIPQEAAAVGKSFPELCEWIIEISMAKYGSR